MLRCFTACVAPPRAHSPEPAAQVEPGMPAQLQSAHDRISHTEARLEDLTQRIGGLENAGEANAAADRMNHMDARLANFTQRITGLESARQANAASDRIVDIFDQRTQRLRQRVDGLQSAASTHREDVASRFTTVERDVRAQRESGRLADARNDANFKELQAMEEDLTRVHENMDTVRSELHQRMDDERRFVERIGHQVFMQPPLMARMMHEMFYHEHPVVGVWLEAQEEMATLGIPHLQPDPFVPEHEAVYERVDRLDARFGRLSNLIGRAQGDLIRLSSIVQLHYADVERNWRNDAASLGQVRNHLQHLTNRMRALENRVRMLEGQ